MNIEVGIPSLIHDCMAVDWATVATAWGSAHGGVNSFNYDLTVSLAKNLNVRVACVVPSAASAEIEEARAAHVHLIAAPELFQPNVAFSIPEALRGLQVCIGHDIQTGHSALRLATQLGNRQHSELSGLRRGEARQFGHVPQSHRAARPFL